jgi:hypothetical protein
MGEHPLQVWLVLGSGPIKDTASLLTSLLYLI